jgi:hypothetical protein
VSFDGSNSKKKVIVITSAIATFFIAAPLGLSIFGRENSLTAAACASVLAALAAVVASRLVDDQK